MPALSHGSDQGEQKLRLFSKLRDSKRHPCAQGRDSGWLGVAAPTLLPHMSTLAPFGSTCGLPAKVVEGGPATSRLVAVNSSSSGHRPGRLGVWLLLCLLSCPPPPPAPSLDPHLTA